MISIEKLNQFYGESHTLWDLNIKADKGDCLAIMGRNGVGKTTLVESIMGLIPVESGKILFQNENLLNLYLIKIKTLIIAIKRFSIKLIIPKGVFAYPPIHAQFNFNLSK